MDLENQVKNIGKEIYEKVSAFVQANKGDDDKLYSNAILRLSDGRKMVVPFNAWGGQPDIKIWNYQWNEELQRGSGDSFSIMPKSGYGFLVDITFYYLDKDQVDFTASEKEYPYKSDLTEEQKETIKSYMAQLYEQISTLVYDKEATRSVGNFTSEAKKQYNIQQFNEEMRKLSETNPDSKVLPSVETAINWWINQFTGSRLGGSIGDDFNSVLAMTMADQVFSQTSVNETQVAAFRESLSKALMDELSKGIEPDLDVDYGPRGILADAMVESRISGSEAPFKTRMVVGVNSVRVSAGYGAKYEEIFADEVEEEKAKRSI